MDNEEFKEKAREHQIEFKRKYLHLEAEDSPTRVIRWKNKYDEPQQKEVLVKSSLRWKDRHDSNKSYVIFYPGFRDEITKEVDKVVGPSAGQMVTNLLRSEHIPYNVFFPMRKDPEGTAKLLNAVLKSQRVTSVDDILIEYNPGGLKDGTSFDVFIRYTSADGGRGGLGIEVKYTEKEYPIKRGSKEWNETHDAAGIHLADNYLKPSVDSRWFKDEYIQDVPFADKAKCSEHVVANRYRQIWRNHILGASMSLGLCAEPCDRLEEFTSLTVYPADNGHFGDGLFDKYREKLTDAGKQTVGHLTFERLFTLMGECLSKEAIPQLDEWINYLRERYIISK